MDFNHLYFEFLSSLVCTGTEKREYSKLLRYLHDTPFRYSIMQDQNRESDGINMRHKFADTYQHGLNYVQIMNTIDNRDCSMLEMMVALSYRIEHDILNDDSIGDQTGKWFWTMIDNIGIDIINSCWDSQLDETIEKMDICLDRDYDYEGHGSFFSVRNPIEDMRETEIWYQANWWITYEYLDWN